MLHGDGTPNAATDKTWYLHTLIQIVNFYGSWSLVAANKLPIVYLAQCFKLDFDETF